MFRGAFKSLLTDRKKKQDMPGDHSHKTVSKSSTKGSAPASSDLKQPCLSIDVSELEAKYQALRSTYRQLPRQRTEHRRNSLRLAMKRHGVHSSVSGRPGTSIRRAPSPLKCTAPARGANQLDRRSPLLAGLKRGSKPSTRSPLKSSNSGSPSSSRSSGTFSLPKRSSPRHQFYDGSGELISRPTAKAPSQSLSKLKQQQTRSITTSPTVSKRPAWVSTTDLPQQQAFTPATRQVKHPAPLVNNSNKDLPLAPNNTSSSRNAHTSYTVVAAPSEDQTGRVSFGFGGSLAAEPSEDILSLKHTANLHRIRRLRAYSSQHSTLISPRGLNAGEGGSNGSGGGDTKGSGAEQSAAVPARQTSLDDDDGDEAGPPTQLKVPGAGGNGRDERKKTSAPDEAITPIISPNKQKRLSGLRSRVRLSFAELRQQQAWGVLASLSLEEMLNKHEGESSNSGSSAKGNAASASARSDLRSHPAPSPIKEDHPHEAYDRRVTEPSPAIDLVQGETRGAKHTRAHSLPQEDFSRQIQQKQSLSIPPPLRDTTTPKKSDGAVTVSLGRLRHQSGDKQKEADGSPTKASTAPDESEAASTSKGLRWRLLGQNRNKNQVTGSKPSVGK